MPLPWTEHGQTEAATLPKMESKLQPWALATSAGRAEHFNFSQAPRPSASAPCIPALGLPVPNPCPSSAPGRGQPSNEMGGARPDSQAALSLPPELHGPFQVASNCPGSRGMALFSFRRGLM